MNTKYSKGVCVVGAQPPPVHGMAVVNSFVAAKLQSIAVPVFLVDLSPRTLSRNQKNRLGRATKVARGLIFSLWTMQSWSALYIGLSGGAGQLYEVLFVLLAKIGRRQVILHHHSFAYLDQGKFITKMLVGIGGRSVTHIVLCDRMGEKLKNQYSAARKVFVLSNAAVMENATELEQVKTELNTLGFLANISFDKGIGQFLDVLEKLSYEGHSIQGIVAGPFQDEQTETEVMSRISAMPNVSYIGPVYDEAKTEFFKAIDALLFPTRYANEAEPLTIYEAFAIGVPVVAWDRGCISGMIPEGAGLAVDREKDFVFEAVKYLELWINDSSQIRNASQRSWKYFRDRQKGMLKNYEDILSLVAGRS